MKVLKDYVYKHKQKNNTLYELFIMLSTGDIKNCYGQWLSILLYIPLRANKHIFNLCLMLIVLSCSCGGRKICCVKQCNSNVNYFLQSLVTGMSSYQP